MAATPATRKAATKPAAKTATTRRPTTPQDRKPSAAEVQKAEALGTTVAVEFEGTEWQVTANALNDFELLEDIDAIDSGNPARLPKVLRRMLGEDQYRKALDALRDEDGVVRVEKGVEFFYAIAAAVNPNS